MRIVMTETTKEQLYGLIIAALAFLIYANSLGNGFLLDDHSVILHNPVIRESPWSFFLKNDTINENQLFPYYRPLTYLTYHLDWRLHNFNPFLVRLENVSLHAANVLLVYHLARAMSACRTTAVIVALFLALHPISTESVDYNAARNNLLSLFFTASTCIIYCRSVIQKSTPLFLCSILLLLAACFSKETSLALLPLLMAAELFHMRNDGQPGSKLRFCWRGALIAAVTACYLFLREVALSRAGVQEQSITDSGGVIARILQNIYIIPRYLANILNPTALSPQYVIPDSFSPYWPQLLLAWIIILAGIIWIFTKGRTKVSLLGLSWLIIFWLPTSGIVYFPSAALADRFLYVPIIGFWLIVADQLRRLIPDSKIAQRSMIIACALIYIMLAALTFRRNLDWKNDMAISSRLVEQYPDNANGHVYLANTYIGEDKFDLAEKSYLRALELDPRQTRAYTPLGLISLRKGDFNGALHYYAKALAAVPYDRDARINSALALDKLDRQQEALEAYRYYLNMPGHNNIPGSQEYALERVEALSRHLGATK